MSRLIFTLPCLLGSFFLLFMLSACNQEATSEAVTSSHCKALTDRERNLLRTVELLNGVDFSTAAGHLAFSYAIKTIRKRNKLYSTLRLAAYCSPSEFDVLLEKTTRSNYLEVKALIFINTAHVAAHISRDARSILGILTGRGKNLPAIITRMTEIIETDTREVMKHVHKYEVFPRGLVYYMDELMRHNPDDGAQILGKILSQLQGNRSGVSPVDFFVTRTTIYGSPYYENIGVLGDYVGALRLSLDKMNISFMETVATVNNILDSAISFGDESGSFSSAKKQILKDIKDARGSNRFITRLLIYAAVPQVGGNLYGGSSIFFQFDSATKNVFKECWH